MLAFASASTPLGVSAVADFLLSPVPALNVFAGAVFLLALSVLVALHLRETKP